MTSSTSQGAPRPTARSNINQGMDCWRLRAAARCDAIVEAVAHDELVSRARATSAMGAVLQDADRLDALGAVGIARTFATAQAMSSRGQASRFYDPEDPLARSGRALDDKRQPVDHFFAKLLKLTDTMHTASAKTEAAKRHRRMKAFLADLEAEL